MSSVSVATRGVLGLAGAVLALLAPLAHAQTQGSPAACPDLAGHYRVDGFGPVLADALKALNAGMAGFTGSEVRISGQAGTALEFRLKSGSTGTLPAAPNFTLRYGADYTCESQRLLLRQRVPATRQTEQGWYEGESAVRLSRTTQGLGLGIISAFSGSQRTTVYSYDSARISLPKAGTRITLTDGIRWPDISEPQAVVPRREPEAPESPDVAAVRRLLDASMLGPVVLGGLQPRGSLVAATLKATRSEQVVAFEDRLQAAAIRYQVARQPVWSDNAWRMELLVHPRGTAVSAPWRPTTLRVEHEVNRLRYPGTDLQKLEATPEGYLATLTLTGQMEAEAVVGRLRQHSKMFAEVAMLSEGPRTDAPSGRAVKVRLTMR